MCSSVFAWFTVVPGYLSRITFTATFGRICDDDAVETLDDDGDDDNNNCDDETVIPTRKTMLCTEMWARMALATYG